MVNPPSFLSFPAPAATSFRPVNGPGLDCFDPASVRHSGPGSTKKLAMVCCLQELVLHVFEDNMCYYHLICVNMF